MVIGIKYCGGCNSTYDRAQEVQRLMGDFPGHTWVYAAHGARQA
ncbi:MAG TPA: beta-hydroxyacyl-ACP dehydratase, partial [Megasphaera sp.]|nr:beta-hydroxyacyl-ACP dehydratase [Megasphaera sp.]